MRARRRLRERDRPAAPGTHRPGSVHSVTVRTTCTSMTCAHRELRSRRAVQGRPASAALRRRLRVLLLTRVRIPLQAFPLMTGLPAPLAVLPALPLGLLPRPPRLFRPDPLLRAKASPSRCCPSTGGAPASASRSSSRRSRLQRRFQRRPSARAICSSFAPITARNREHQVSLLASRPRLIGHEPQACSTCTKSSTTAARRRVCHAQPREWTPLGAPGRGLSTDAEYWIRLPLTIEFCDVR